MSDNTQLPTPGAGDTIRTLDKTGRGLPKTEAVVLDIAGGNGRAEQILSVPVPVGLPELAVDDEGIPLVSLSPATMDAIEMLFRQLIAIVAADVT